MKFEQVCKSENKSDIEVKENWSPGVNVLQNTQVNCMQLEFLMHDMYRRENWNQAKAYYFKQFSREFSMKVFMKVGN